MNPRTHADPERPPLPARAGRSLRAALVAAVLAAATVAPGAAAGAPGSGYGQGCPTAAPAAGGTNAPLVTVQPSSVSQGSSPAVTIAALVADQGQAASAFVRFGESPGYGRCSSSVRLAASSAKLPLRIPLAGLIPHASYHYELVASSAGGTTIGPVGTFVAPGPQTVAAGVSVGPISLAGDSRSAALARLQEFLAAPLRFTFEGVYWSAPRARLGAEIDPPATVSRALAATPGTRLPLELTIDGSRLNSYLATLGPRFAHSARGASIRLVGSHAVVEPAAALVAVDVARMASAIRSALDSGLSERLGLITQPATSAKAPPVKAVVVRLRSQTLTAYLNGKAILTTPVTTGRPALPTPVGSYHVIFHESPFVFHSPWPPGSPFWYPPTPVTWVMDFFGGDFLHDDPGEPSDAFGAGSEYGPYASHGCVHVPHSVMAFLYTWLPNGAQVVVSDT